MTIEKSGFEFAVGMNVGLSTILCDGREYTGTITAINEFYVHLYNVGTLIINREKILNMWPI